MIESLLPSDVLKSSPLRSSAWILAVLHPIHFLVSAFTVSPFPLMFRAA